MTAETARPAALVVRAGLVAVAVARVLAPVLAMRAPGAARPFALVVGRAASLVPVPVCVWWTELWRRYVSHTTSSALLSNGTMDWF